MKSVEFFAPHMAKGLELKSERNLPYGALSDGASARFIAKTAVHTGPGYRSVSNLAQSAAVDDLYPAQHAELRKLWAKCGTKLFHSVDTVSAGYDSGLTLSASERLFLTEQPNGDLFGFNQTDTPFRIAAAKNSVIVNFGDTTITIGAGYVGKFAASGTVYMNGTALTYSGKNATQLTGVATIPAGGYPVGTLVTQTSTPASMVDLAGNAVKGTCAMEVEGSLLVAGILGSEDTVRISAPSSLDAPQFFYDFADNGASFKVMPGPVTAMAKGTERSYIFGENYIAPVLGFHAATGVLQTTQFPTGYGAYNPRCTAVMGGRVLAFGDRKIYPIDVVVSNNPDEPKKSQVDEDFDSAIRPWLDTLDDDQTDKALLVYDSTQKLVSATGTVDGVTQTHVYDNNEGVKAWLPREARPARCHVFYSGTGKSYFGNNVNSKIYENHIGRTNDGVAIAHRFTTGLLEDPKKRLDLLPNFLRINGFLSQACEFTLKIYLNGSSQAAWEEDYTDSIITSSIGTPIGTRGVGSSAIAGDAGVPVLAYPFEDIEIELTGLQGKSVKIEMICNKEGGFLQWNSFLLDCHTIRFSSRDRI